MRIRFLWIILLVTACEPTPVITDSPALKHWTKEEQQQILAEERKLPADSILIAVLEDYARLRAALRPIQP